MATSVAHGLIGIATYAGFVLALPATRRLPSGSKSLVLAALAANIPDLDMLVSLLVHNDHVLLHGGITHSFAFAACLALVLWLFTYRWSWQPVLAIGFFFLVASHVVVDWLTGPRLGFYPSHGLAPFWPLSDVSLPLPMTAFKGVNHGDLLPGALYTALWEFILIAPLTLLLIIKLRNVHSETELISLHHGAG
jgi:membrane-bound metal-dependent hydrolase YbcI (DUF457 family)